VPHQQKTLLFTHALERQKCHQVQEQL